MKNPRQFATAATCHINDKRM